MLLEYLTKRKEILIYRLKKNQDKLDHNLIAIVESKNKYYSFPFFVFSYVILWT